MKAYSALDLIILYEDPVVSIGVFDYGEGDPVVSIGVFFYSGEGAWLNCKPRWRGASL